MSEIIKMLPRFSCNFLINFFYNFELCDHSCYYLLLFSFNRKARCKVSNRGTSSHQRGNFLLIRRLGLKYRLPYALQSFLDCRRIVIMHDEANGYCRKARNLEPV